MVFSLSLFDNNSTQTLGFLRIDQQGDVVLKKWYQDLAHPLRSFGPLRMIANEEDIVVAGDRYL